MPLFFFASGCIFAYQLEVKRKPMTFAQLLRNKTKRLMVPFYAFALLMVYPTMTFLEFRDPVHYFFDGFILAIDPRHLWFVMTLFLLFLLFFGLRKICNKLHIPIWATSILALLIYSFPINIAYFQIRNVEEYLIWFTLGYLFTIYKPVFKYVAIAALCGLGFNITMPEFTPLFVKIIQCHCWGYGILHPLCANNKNRKDQVVSVGSAKFIWDLFVSCHDYLLAGIYSCSLSNQLISAIHSSLCNQLDTFYFIDSNGQKARTGNYHR